MKRPFLGFVVSVVLPTAAAMAACGLLAHRAWTDVQFGSHERVAGMVLAALDQELVAAGIRATDLAEPVDDSDPSDPSVRRALQGDTVRGYRLGADGLEVLTVLADEDGGAVRVGRATVDDRFVHQVAAATGYSIAVYAGSTRWAASIGADSESGLPPEVAIPPVGVGRTLYDGGVLRVADAGPAGASTPAAMVVPVGDALPILARPFVLVLALLLLFSTLAAWIQLSRAPDRLEARTRPGVSFGVLALIPLLAAVGLMSHLDRRFTGQADEAARRDLTRALSVAALRDITGSPRAVRQLTGFDAVLIRQGLVVASSTQTDPPSPDIAHLPAPPPSFTSTGTLEVGGTEVLYAGMRRPEGGSLVVTTLAPTDRIDRLRGRVRLIVMLLTLWVAGAAFMAVRADRHSNPSTTH